jgi:PAS domain-containing protein
MLDRQPHPDYAPPSFPNSYYVSINRLTPASARGGSSPGKRRAHYWTSQEGRIGCNPDLVILSADGPAGWSFEGAMEELTKAGHNPLVVSDRCDDLILSRAYISGAQGVVPATAAEALVSAIRWCLGVAADRSALAKAEAIQAETSSREESLLDSSRDPVAYIHEGMHIRANRAYLDFFGLEDMDEIDGLPFLDLVSPEFSATAKAILKAAARGEIPDNGIELSMASPTRGSIPTQVEIANASYEGEPCLQVTLRSAASDLEPADTQSSSMLAQKWWDSVRDIAEKETNSALVLAYMDNPEEIFSSVPIQYRGNMPNQLYEQMLIAATTATSGNGAFSSLVDLGGGTYGLLFSATNADADATMGQAKTFKDLLGDVTVILGDQALKPGFSVSGVAIGKKIGWSSTPEAISMAERGIPKAKKSSGFCWFDPSTQDREEMRRRRDLTDLVRKACSTEDGLVLHYRPILPLAGPSTHIYEAFVRMIGANGELMYPQDFMGVSPT